MRKILSVIVASMLAPMVFAGDGLPDQPFVQVAGTGLLKAQPDYVEVNLLVSAVAKDGATARRDVDAKLIAVAEILERLQLPKSFLEAYQLEVMEEREYIDDELTTVGFRAIRQAKLSIRELDRAQEIMDALIDAPIEIWEDIEAHVDDVEALREKAKIAAFEDAKRRAEIYAKLAGRKVGEVYRIGDEINWNATMLSSVMVTGSSVKNRERLPLFQLGDIEVEQQVRVIYLLE